MENQEILIKGNTSSGIAALGGGGAGTLLVVLAQNLPNTYTWKSWLVIIALSLAVALSGFWLWASREINRYMTKIRIDRMVKQTREFLESRIKDPNTEPELREEYKKQLIKLEYSHFKFRMATIKFSEEK